MRVGSLIVAVIAAVSASAQSDPVRELNASRKSLKPFYATYLEVNKVSGKLASSDGTPGWGSGDSTIQIEAAVDATSGSLIYQDMNGKPKDASTARAGGGTQVYFNDGKVNYDLIEGGKRGGFGSHPSGMVNPAAAAYEYSGVPASQYFDKYHYVVDGPDQVTTSGRTSTTTFKFSKFGNQTVLVSRHTKSVNADEGMDRDLTLTVQSWVDYLGLKYPGVVDFEYLDHGQPSITRTYTLQKIHEDRTGPLKVTIPEGGLIKDYDLNIVYNMRGGKLVPNPIFNREVASATTIRRVGFILAILLLIAWALYRLRTRPSKRLG